MFASAAHVLSQNLIHTQTQKKEEEEVGNAYE